MGFVHYTLVGHFNPASVFINETKNLTVSRPIDRKKLETLLEEYEKVVSTQVTLQDGYVRCQWAPSTCGEEVIEVAYRLARLEKAIAVENGREVTFPPEATRKQAEVWERTMNKPGLAAEREAHAKTAAADFEEKLRKRAADASPRAARLKRVLDEIGKRKFSHARRAGCVVKDDGGWPDDSAVRDTVEACGGDLSAVEEMLNRRFVIADVLDKIAPKETWTAADLQVVATAMARALEKQLVEQFPAQKFAVEVVGAAMAEDEPLEVSVTFHRAV